MNPKLLLGLALVLSGNCHAAIVYPKAPEGGRQIVQAELGDIQRSLRINDLTIAEPHRYYIVRPEDIAWGHLLSAATFSSWRYILMHGTNGVATVVVLDADPKTGQPLRENGWMESESAKILLNALRLAQTLPQIKEQDYEFRSVGFRTYFGLWAVWLHGKSDDILMPLNTTDGLNAYQCYSDSSPE